MTDADTVLSLQAVRAACDNVELAMEGYLPDQPEPLISAVSAFSTVVAAINQRLRTTHGMLKDGRRIEAIHACETDPNLLDCVTELDRIDQAIEPWFSVLDELGIGRPQRLLSDLAGELSESYDVKEQVAHLLRLHRLLAIAHAPLEERVVVLRRLLEIDPNHLGWRADLREYELACQQQLLDEFRDVLQASAKVELRDLSASKRRAKQLYQQLMSAEWIDPLPMDSVQQVQKSFQSIQARYALVELRSLADSLLRARQSNDLGLASQLAKRWAAVRPFVPHSTADQSLAQGDNVCEWVDTLVFRRAVQQARADAASMLESAMLEPLPWLPSRARQMGATLSELVAQLQDGGARCPHSEREMDIIEAARNRVARLARIPARSTSIAIVSVAALALFLFGSASVAVARFQRAKVLRDAYTELETILDRDGARSCLAELRQLLKSHPWIELSADLPEIETLVADRQASAERSLEDSESTIQRVLTRFHDVMREQADRLTGTRPTFDELGRYREIKQATSDAITRARTDIKEAKQAGLRLEQDLADAKDSDLDRFSTLATTSEDEIASRERQFRADRAAWVGNLRRVLEDEIASLEQDKHDDRELVERIQVARDHARELRLLKEPSAAGDDGYEARFAAIEKARNVRQGNNDLIQRLDEAAARGFDAYLRAIREESGRERQQDSDLVDSIKSVAQSATSLESAVLWSDVLSAWKKTIPTDRESRDSWRASLQRGLAAVPQPPFSQEERENLAALQAALSTVEGATNRLWRNLRDFLDQKIFDQEVLVLYLGGKKPQRYYAMPSSRDEGRCFKDYTDADSRYLDLKNASSKNFVPAPHAALAERLRNVCSDVLDDSADPDEAVRGALTLLASSAVQDNRDCDPLILSVLLLKVLDIAALCPLYRADAEASDLLNRLLDDVGPTPIWIDPERRESAKGEAASRILGSGSVKKIIEAFEVRREKALTPPATCRRLRFIGWLARNDSWLTLHVVAKDERLNRSQLCIVLPPTGSDGRKDAAFRYHDVQPGECSQSWESRKPWAAFSRPVFATELDLK